MKKIRFTCNYCDAKLRVPTHLAGVSAPCPKCGVTITAPTDITHAFEDEVDSRRSTASVMSRVANGVVPTDLAVRSSLQVSELPTPIPSPQISRTLAQSQTPAEIPASPAVSEASSDTAPSEAPSDTEVESPATFAVPLETNFPPPPPPIQWGDPDELPDDPRSDAPVSLPPLSPVVVEVTPIPIVSSPALAPITQPIQVNPRPSAIPQSRSGVTGSNPLPRLDVSLAGQDLSAVGTLLFSENGNNQGRMIVQLPQLGAETHNFSPEDFIVPPAPTPLVPPAPPVSETDPILGTDNPPPLEPAIIEDPLPDPEESRETPVPRYMSIPLPNERSPIPLEDIGEDEPLDDLSEEYDDLAEAHFTDSEFEPPETFFSDVPDHGTPTAAPQFPDWIGTANAESSTDSPDEPWDSESDTSAYKHPDEEVLPADFYRDIPDTGLHEGSFGKLFSQVPTPTREPAEASLAGPPRTPMHDPRTETSEVALPEPVRRPHRGGEGDILEEIFRRDSESVKPSKGPSKTTVVMLSCIGGAAIIATIMVVVLWQVMGGRVPVDAYKGSPAENAVKTQDNKAVPTALVNEPSITDAPAVIDPVAILRETGVTPPDKPEMARESGESAALSFDERVQQVINRSGQTEGGSVIGSPSLDLVDNAIDKFTSSGNPIQITPVVPPAKPTQAAGIEASPAAAVPAPPLGAVPLSPASAPTGNPVATEVPAAKSVSTPVAKVTNYNPPPTFAAPGPNDSPLLRTNDLIDAFVRAPDWQTRIKYTYQGESLRPAIEDYYKKWPDLKVERFTPQLFQMEQSAELGGPYWVYLVSTSDADQGFPLIIRVEEGNLKVDWEIFSEFYDQHFVRFREGVMPRPATFRLVIERVSDYYGTDREAFTDLKDYHVYQINPPYGALDEFSEYAFVKKDSPLAKKLDSVVGLGDEPLAVIITLDEKTFEHGVKHYVVSEYLTEGWFR